MTAGEATASPAASLEQLLSRKAALTRDAARLEEERQTTESQRARLLVDGADPEDVERASRSIERLDSRIRGIQSALTLLGEQIPEARRELAAERLREARAEFDERCAALEAATQAIDDETLRWYEEQLKPLIANRETLGEAARASLNRVREMYRSANRDYERLGAETRFDDIANGLLVRPALDVLPAVAEPAAAPPIR